jgi:inorganic pyrophosphatase
MAAVSLIDLDPGSQCPDVVRMIVEIPKNSTNKYEYDKQLGLFRLDRALYSPVHYPGDYGFVPGTLEEDRDPIDILALTDEPAFPGCLIEVRPLGVLEMVDREEADLKVLAVPVGDPRFEQLEDIRDVAPHVRKEIEHFFNIYKQLEKKKVTTRGWRPSTDARKAIQAARARYLAGKQES